MTSDELLGEIVAEAERSRASRPQLEESLAEAFAAIAADPRVLELELEHRRRERERPTHETAPAAAQGAMWRLFLGRARRGLRRRVGPTLRRLQRKMIEEAAAASAGASTRTEIAREAAGRIAMRRRVERLLAPLRVGTVLPPSPPALRIEGGRIGDALLDEFVIARLSETDGPVLHVESGDGSFVARLRQLGREVSGADPRHGAGPARRGGLEALGRREPSSLGAVVVSGLADSLTPSRARALARLVASRLSAGGAVVLLSASPSREALDPVTADLTPGRPLHSVTWSHLFAQLGLERVVVAEAADKTGYAVAARKGPAQ